MPHVLKLSQSDPVIHIKAYGGLRIQGVEGTEVQCEIDALQLATLKEEQGHVYITANATCELTVPPGATLEMEKCMGSVSVTGITAPITIEKVMGNLVLIHFSHARIEKVGGNFSARNASGEVHVEKIGGSLVVDGAGSVYCEKVGGTCKVQNVTGEFSLVKTGGNFKAQNIQGVTHFEKAGGSIVRAGGRIKLLDFRMTDDLELRAGGEIELAVGEDFPGAVLDLRSGAHKIVLNVGDIDLTSNSDVYEYQFGDSSVGLTAHAGGFVNIHTLTEPLEDLMGDLSDDFVYEESAFSEMIQERVESATRRAEVKVRAAEQRLERIQENVEKHRGFALDVDFEPKNVRAPNNPSGVVPPVPPVSRPAGKKGPSDEERLMILKMLQDKKITVEEAETLFNALEE